jgi:hypothetical protein
MKKWIVNLDIKLSRQQYEELRAEIIDLGISEKDFNDYDNMHMFMTKAKIRTGRAKRHIEFSLYPKEFKELSIKIIEMGLISVKDYEEYIRNLFLKEENGIRKIEYYYNDDYGHWS